MPIRTELIDYVNFTHDKQIKTIQQICRNDEIGKVFDEAKNPLGEPLMYLLIDLAKELKGKMRAYKDDIIYLLNSENPKVRTKTLRIIKLADPSFFVETVIEAFKKEEILYTYPDYIRTIAAAINERAERFLNSYELRSTSGKHLREEKKALDKAKARFIKRTDANPKIQASDTIFITAPNLNVTQNEFAKLGIKTKKDKKYLHLNDLHNYDDVFQVRAFTDAYILLGICPTDKIPDFINNNENRIHDLIGVKNYRLEIKGVPHKERIALISETAGKNSILINAPSAYSFEILADIKDDIAVILLNPLIDERFSYRKESVPASVAGAGAASVCAFASEYFKPDAKVLDNFCGSGTMLFERGFYKHGKLIGADINDKAIKAAEINSEFAKVHPKFIHMDAMKFNAEKFDEIITNMPFGHRVGNHNKNEKLYREYIKMLPSILAYNGIAVLYTQEKRLLEKMLRPEPALKLLKKGTFEAGGLNPSAYVLQKISS